MSVHNSLMKPSFTKSVMGYNTGEVDKYVEHVTERYNSVCKENVELKRRLLSESVRIRETEERIAELERSVKVGVALDKSSLVKIFDMLNAEKDRFTYFVESLKESLNAICDESVDNLMADDSWEDALDGYIEEVSNAGESDDAAAEESDSTGFYEIDEGAESYDAETDGILSIFSDASDDVIEDDSESDADDSHTDDIPVADETDADAVEEADDTASDTEDGKNDDEADPRTPAQIAADLDFYTDGDHADGESFDPMTLAAQITARNSRPKSQDFIKIVPSEEE